MKKALFLDRDGTIIHNMHYLGDPDGVKLLPRAKEALQAALKLGYELFMFTNQSGISRGYFTWEDLHACNQRMLELLDIKEDLFTEICVAPEKPDDEIIYRKPSPKFILESIKKYDLDPKNCWMLGDKDVDVEAGLNAKINSALVTYDNIISDELRGFLEENSVDAFENLMDFVSAKLIG